MYIKVFVSLMVLLCVLGFISGGILYYGFDPSKNPIWGIIMMWISFVLTFWSLVWLILLLIKKITARGYIHTIDTYRSFRHGILIALFLAICYIFSLFHILTVLTWFLLFCIFILVEMILTKIEDT